MSDFHHTTRWRKLRAFKLLQSPLCEIHLMKNETVRASEVHHLLNVDDFPEEAMNMMYLQSLCGECHGQISGNDWKKGRGTG